MAEVRAPGGASWIVQRCWAPRVLGRDSYLARLDRRQREWRRGVKEHADLLIEDGAAPAPDDDALGVVMIILLSTAALAVLVVVLPLAIVAAVELVALIVLIVLGVLAKVLLRRPWTVEAVGPDAARHEWRIVGWRRSGEAVATIAQHLAATGRPPQL